MPEPPGPSSAELGEIATRHLETLCAADPDRRPGSDGNRAATEYAASALSELGWAVVRPSFETMDWSSEGGALRFGDTVVTLTPSPYGCGVSTSGPIRIVRTEADLDRSDLRGSVLVLTGELAKEPFTPKAFPFYRNDDHARITRRLEHAAPAAVIGVTGKFPALCGALDPYPLIEDGDFTIPAASLRPADAAPLLAADNEPAHIEIRAARWVAEAENVIAARGDQSHRVTVIAHIDTKPGTPGAVDNAAGVVVLLLLADLLAPGRSPTLPVGLELLAVNGEDHFGAPGELDWLAVHEDRLHEVALVVNIDGAGYRGAPSAYSMYNCEGDLATRVAGAFADVGSIVNGPDWYQSDHAIFAMRGHPAVAFTTHLVDEMLETLFHAPTDTPDQVDVALLVDVAQAIAGLVTAWPAPEALAGG